MLRAGVLIRNNIRSPTGAGDRTRLPGADNGNSSRWKAVRRQWHGGGTVYQRIAWQATDTGIHRS